MDLHIVWSTGLVNIENITHASTARARARTCARARALSLALLHLLNCFMTFMYVVLTHPAFGVRPPGPTAARDTQGTNGKKATSETRSDEGGATTAAQARSPATTGRQAGDTDAGSNRVATTATTNGGGGEDEDEDEEQTNSSTDEGASSGTTGVGIVVGVVLAIVIAVGAIFLAKKCSRDASNTPPPFPPLPPDTAVYNRAFIRNALYVPCPMLSPVPTAGCWLPCVCLCCCGGCAGQRRGSHL